MPATASLKSFILAALPSRRGLIKAKQTRIVLFVAAVIMAAVLALYAFPREPRVMAVEFEGHWAGAVLEGNEIVPNLVAMAVGWRDEGSGRLPGRGAEELTPQQLARCWSTRETLAAPRGWRERLTPRQAREFEIIYCTAVLRAASNRALEDCAWMRDGETVGCPDPVRPQKR